MNLFTNVEISKIRPQIGYGDQLLLMGSCFATEMGERLKEAKFTCKVNPFGVLYNPMSIAKSIRQLGKSFSLTGEKIFPNEGLYHSLSFHGDFSATTPEKLEENIRLSLDACKNVLTQSSWFLLTFGSAFVYEWKETGEIVANCHKLPEKLFNRRRLSVDEIVEEYQQLLPMLWKQNSKLKVMLTVSPIRYLRDGLHENQLSKATLHLAIDTLQQAFPDKVVYFPAYELLMDELRDYRFYADDLTHPSKMAVDYIWQRFCEACCSAETIEMMKSVKEIKKMLEHRPLHPESEEYVKFLHQIVLKIETLSEKCPYFDFEKEKELCLTRLNRLH